MKVMVTGGCGFIGSHVVEALLNAGHDVAVVDNFFTGKAENIPQLPGHSPVLCDMCDIRNVYNLTEVFRAKSPEVVFHLAAQPSIATSIERPFEDLGVNGLGTLNVIHAAQECGARRIVFASTSAVYPADVQICMEGGPLEPGSPYGISKLAAENYLRLYGHATVLRLGNVYGPRQVPLGENQVIPRMIRHLFIGDKFSIHGDGMQVRDFVYVEDVAQAFLKSAREEGFHLYNIASGRRCSVNYLAELLNDIFNLGRYPWNHDELYDPRRSVNMLVTAAQYHLDWSAQTSLTDGLRKTVEWWRQKEKI